MHLKRYALRLAAVAILVSTAVAFAAPNSDSPHNDALRGIEQAYNSSDWDHAITRATAYLQSDRTSEEAWRIRGCAYSRKWDWDHALDDLSHALAMNPKDADAYACHAFVFEQKGVRDEALADYNEAIKLEPSIARFYGYRGDYYFDQHQYALAVADFTSAINLAPTVSHYYNSRGLSYWWENEFRPALADFDQAVHLDPNNRNAAANQKELRARMLGEAPWHKVPWLIPVLILIACVPLLLVVLLLSSSRGMFRRHIDRCFVKKSNGLLVFYPRMVGKGYVVPNAERAAQLRKGMTRIHCLTIAIVVLPSVFAPALLQHSSLIGPEGLVSCGILFGLVAVASWFLGVRWLTHGLLKVAEKRRLSWRERYRESLRDTPAYVHWIAFVLFLGIAARGSFLMLHASSWIGRSMALFDVIFGGFFAVQTFRSIRSARLEGTPS